jgi:predicted permease
MNDLKFAFRQLLKNPGFTVVAVLTLALGIGANTAIFGVLNELLFKPLPVKHPDSLAALVLLDRHGGRSDQSISYPVYRDYAELNGAFSETIAYASLFTRVKTTNGREMIQAQIVSGNYFSALGVQPALGRAFSTDEDKVPLRDAVAVISRDFWTNQFNADPAVIGKSLQLDDPIAGPMDFTIVGVGPAEFGGFEQLSPAVWLPTAMHSHFIRSQLLNFHIIGRLAARMSALQATSNLNVVTDRIAEKYRGARIPGYEDDPPFQAGLRVLLHPAGRGLWGPFRARQEIWSAATLSFGIVVLVLLIGCANVANLLLARAATRHREIAVRLSLGASRGQLLRQFMAESLVLAVLACGVGLFFAQWSNALLVAMKPGNVPLVAAHLDFRVVSFAVVVTLLTAILFGLAPAWQGTKIDLNGALKDDSRAAAGTVRRHDLTNTLIVGQMAFSLVLLISAGLCLRSFDRLQAVDPGFDCTNLIIASLDLDAADITEKTGSTFYRQLLDRIDSLPGVRSTSFSMSAPLSPGGWMSGPPLTEIEGYVPRPGEAMETKVHIVGPDFFETLHIPKTRTSGASRQDHRERIFVNESFARRFWPGIDPVGRQLGKWRVDGVVRDCRLRELWNPAEPEIFWERQQPLGSQCQLLVRTDGETLAVMSAVRQELAAINRSIKVTGLQTMPQMVQRSLGTQRFALALVGTVALTALFLAAVGIYGVMSFIVAQRTREIGLRIALGAKQTQVLTLIIRQGLKLVLIGAVLGTLAALALTRILASRLYEVTPTDPLTFALVPVLLTSVAVAACWLPARRAARVDPMEALRCE